MDIKLNLIFVNNDSYIEQVSITANKTTLVNCSSYFKSLFEGGFTESTKNELDIDLTQLKCTYSINYIKQLFDIELNLDYDYVQAKSNRNIKVVLDTNLNKELKSTHNIKIDLGLGENVHIHELYILESLASFFDFTKSTKIIEMCLINYKKLINQMIEEAEEEYADECDMLCAIDCGVESDGDCDYSGEFEECECDGVHEDGCEANCIEVCEEKPVEVAIVSKPKYNYDTKPCIIESYELYFNKILNIHSSTLQTELDILRKSIVISDFLQNIYYIYLGYVKSGKRKIFNEIIASISKKLKADKQSHNVTIYLDNFNVLLSGIALSCDNLKQIPLEDCYELLNAGDKHIITLESNIFKLYDFYDILDYEKSNWKTFDVSNIENNYQVGMKCIRDNDIVLKDFNDKTKGLFHELDWSNIIITGGFIFGLVNNLNNSLISSTDIDMFVYSDGDEDLLQEKVDYLLTYFNKFDPYYVKRGKVITLIIPELDYDIQIIPTTKTSPYDIVDTFDFGFVKIFYDGTDIYTTLEGLIGLKYAVTSYKPQKEDNTIDSVRLYKTVIKGLQIKYDPIIKNKCISGSTINFSELDNDTNIKLALNKATIVKKLMKYAEGYELIPIIKTYYKSNNVTLDIFNINKLPEKTEYDPFTTNVIKNKFDVKQIKDLVKVHYSHPSNKQFSWYSFAMDNGKQLDKLRLEINYCNFAIYRENINEPNEKLALRLNLDNETGKKLYDLDKRLRQLTKQSTDKILAKSVKSTLNICCIEDEEEEEAREVDDYTYMQLKVHMPNNKNTQKIKSIIDKLDSSRDQVNVICSGKLWVTGTMAGVKFYIEEIKYKKSYNMI